MAGMARAVDIRSANPPVSARARVPSCVTVLQPPFNSAPFRNLRIVAPCVAREPHRAGGSASAPFAHEGPLAEQRLRSIDISRRVGSGEELHSRHDIAIFRRRAGHFRSQGNVERHLRDQTTIFGATTGIFGDQTAMFDDKVGQFKR